MTEEPRNLEERKPEPRPVAEEKPTFGFRDRVEQYMEAITFAEAGQPEVAREILGIQPSLAGRVYGEIVYWGTVAAAVIAMLGQVFSFVSNKNYVDPAYMLSAIWQSKSVAQIWEGATGALPNGHWYLHHLATGNGLTEFGIAVGVFVVIPAMLGAAIILYRDRSPLFATLAVVAAFITIASMVGMIPLPIA